MSVTAITEKAPPRLSDTLNGGKTVTRTLQAICSEKTDGPVTIQAHASCPAKGSTYSYGTESDSTLVCTGVSIDPVADDGGYEGSKVHQITATYSNSVDTGSLGDDEENPLDDPAIIEWSSNTYQVPAIADRDGNALVNGANESFDPPHLLEEHRPVCIITRNEAAYNAAIANEYANAVNSDNFAGIEPGYAKMLPPRARRVTRGSYTYWEVVYEIEISKRQYNPTGILAQGFKYRPAAGDQEQNYIDPATNQPPSSPILLNLDGTKADDPLGDGALPVFHEFNFFPEKPFGVFNFGL